MAAKLERDSGKKKSFLEKLLKKQRDGLKPQCTGYLLDVCNTGFESGQIFTTLKIFSSRNIYDFDLKNPIQKMKIEQLFLEIYDK
jgi:hypothetical protein